MSDCVFCGIAKGSIPSKLVHEDDEILVFHDIHPAATVHYLIIPRRHIESLDQCEPSDAALLGRMLLVGKKVAREAGLHNGFRMAIHTGVGGGQVVFHLHMHVMGEPVAAS